MQKKFYLLLALALVFTSTLSAQISSGSLQGEVTDKDTGEPLPFVQVVVYLNGNIVTGGSTDIDGKYTIKPIDPGTFDLQFNFVGYTQLLIQGIPVSSGKIAFANAKMSSSVELGVVEVVAFKVPLIDKDGGASGGTVTRDEIEKMPGRSALGLATTVAGVSTSGTGGGISIRGARTGSTWIYIDGIKVRGSTSLPKSAIEEISVITGGIPANIGDVTGGVINISLRNSSSVYTGGIEVVSSGFKSGEKTIGLDHYGYNLIEGSVSGPLLFKKDAEGNPERPILGFFVSANYTDIVDPDPAFGGQYRMKEDARQQLLISPLRLNEQNGGIANGALYSADFLQEDSFEKVNTNLNIRSRAASLVAKIDVNTSPNMTLTFGGTAAFDRYHNRNRANSLMNWENNSRNTNLDWRGYVKFSQRFKNAEDESAASTLKNVFYSVMVDYSRTYRRNEDDTHKDEFFKYGHVGYFDLWRGNTYEFTGAYFKQNGIQDVHVDFTPSPYNPEIAAMTNQYFGLFDQNQNILNQLVQDPSDIILDGQTIFDIAIDPYSSFTQIQGGNGLINGEVPDQTYGLWNYQGTQSNDYSIESTGQFRVTAAGSADIGDHALQLGFEYEQRRDSRFAVSPVALWEQARLLANSHTQELDLSDSTEIINGTYSYFYYEQLIGDGQFEFDYRLREALGLDPNGNDFINIDNLDPEELSLDMFGAEDLLNGGNAYVAYYGYDHHGNKLSGRPSIDDFFTEQYQLGDKFYYTRPVGAFEPIYTSGYIMDKFAFDDLIFNLGVRIDRYDANQPVPKDPYVINEAFTAGEVAELGGFPVNHPANIGSDFVVYVNDLDQPTGVSGYRNGDIWYNASGQEISNPDVIASGGRVNPYLKNDPDAPLSSGAFTDYDPSVTVMPRIAFSFPISDEALFFAHYDILTQRPRSDNRFNPVGYLFMEGRNDLLNNPALKPEKTVDYALGFQQILSRTSSLKLEAFYREMRDMIQVRNFTGAYPNTYSAFGNLDFGTVKGLTLTYDLRRTGNMWIKTSYTMQFADGTGSTTETALALINAGLPNLRTISPLNYDQRHRIVTTLDYRFGGGTDFTGPIVLKPFLENTGVNFIANLGSGTPYTASVNPYSINGGSPNTEGSINGSHLPWQFSLDLNLDRNFLLKFSGEGDEAKTANLNVYLWVSNVLNTQNIANVYRFTGIPNDDGYLAAAQFQPEINSQTDVAAYKNYYRMNVDNPYNLGAPRTIRLGLRFDF